MDLNNRLRLSCQLSVLGLAACVHVSDVTGPNGETAHVIRCPRSEQCLEKAVELCPEGYVLRSNSTKISGYVANGQGSVSTSQEIFVSCKADLAAPPTSAPAPVAARQDERVCNAAFVFVDGFGTYWVTHSPGGKLLEEKPQERDFVLMCRSMPENVQRCLHDKFRTLHEKACDALLLRLDDGARGKIDGLFLEAPATPNASAPGGPAAP